MNGFTPFCEHETLFLLYIFLICLIFPSSSKPKISQPVSYLQKTTTTTKNGEIASCGPSRGFNLCAVLETHAKHLNASHFSDTGSGVLCLQPLYWNASPVFNYPKARRKLVLRLITFLKMKQEIKRHHTKKRATVWASLPVDALHSFTSCAKQSSQKVLPRCVARQEFCFWRISPGGFDSFFAVHSDSMCFDPVNSSDSLALRPRRLVGFRRQDLAASCPTQGRAEGAQK